MVTHVFDCVVAADRRGGIGKDGDLPWPKLKADLAHFARVTTDVAAGAPAGHRNAVIMGSKTWRSVPERFRPLPRRLNVVVSRRGLEVPDGVLVAGGLDAALAAARAVPEVAGLFVVGGGELYRLAFAHPGCRDVYLTRLDADFACDTFIELPPAFACAEVLAHHDEAGVRYVIERWRRT